MDYGAMYMICHPCEKGSDKALTSIQYLYIIIYNHISWLRVKTMPTHFPPPKKKTTNQHPFFVWLVAAKKCSEMMAECLAMPTCHSCHS